MDKGIWGRRPPDQGRYGLVAIMGKYSAATLKFSIKEADIVLSNTIGVFLATKFFLSGTYHENHNVKSEIRNKFE